MPEQLWFTAILNHLLAAPVTALLRAIHIEPQFPQSPITNGVAMQLLVFLFLVALFLLTRMRLSIERPGPLQHAFEGMYSFVYEQTESIAGHGSEKFIGFLMVLGLFVLLCNLIGLIPGFESPTGLPSVPLGCALVTFGYYNWQGLKKHNPWGYFKHFMGPMPALAILMFPIEIISHTARLLSLTVRLWANMYAGDLITLVFFSMIPIGVPVVFLGLHLLVAVLQAYVFMLLTIIYIAGAVAEEH